MLGFGSRERVPRVAVLSRFPPRLLARVALSFLFRFACYAVMVALVLWAEGRPAPRLPDLVLDHVPYVEAVDRYNYWLWVVAYVPVALALLWTDAERFVRYMVSSGLLALVRGVSIVVTGLGPVRGDDVHAGVDMLTWQNFTDIAAPWLFLARDAGARAWFTKDLFFSGHTATTCLLLLYVWRWPRLRAAMLLAHVAVVASVFLAHLHYTIDVLGAYFAAVALFALREGQVGAAVSAPPPPP